MVETELGFFEMEVEGMFWDAVELEQAAFGEAPEAFDSVDVVRSADELVLSVADPEVLVEAEINQSVVASPAIGMEDGFEPNSAADDRLQSGFGRVRHDLGIDLVPSFEQTEDDGLAAGSSSSFAAHTARAEVRLVGFDFALERRAALTGFGHPAPHSQKNRIHGTDREAADRRALRRRQIQHKTSNQMTKSRFTDLGMPIILVNPNHHKRLALSSKSFAS